MRFFLILATILVPTGLLIGGLLVLIFWPEWRRKQFFQQAPAFQSPATVLSKNQHTSGTAVRRASYGRYPLVRSYITFTLPDGERKDFEVSAHTYNTVMENDSGLLTFRESQNGRFFVRFARQK